MWWKSIPWKRARGFGIRVIADDGGNGEAQFPGLVAVQQVRQAVQMLRDEEGHARRMRHQVETPAHVEPGRQRLEFPAKALQVEALELPFHPHEEEFGFGILVLIGVRDVGAVAVQQVGDTGHQTFPVGTIDEQNGSIPHGPFRVAFLAGYRQRVRYTPRVCYH